MIKYPLRYIKAINDDSIRPRDYIASRNMFGISINRRRKISTQRKGGNEGKAKEAKSRGRKVSFIFNNMLGRMRKSDGMRR